MPGTQFGRKKPGNAGTPRRNSSRVAPKPYWPGLMVDEDEKISAGNDQKEMTTKSIEKENIEMEVQGKQNIELKEKTTSKTTAVIATPETKQDDKGRKNSTSVRSRMRRRKRSSVCLDDYEDGNNDTYKANLNLNTMITPVKNNILPSDLAGESGSAKTDSQRGREKPINNKITATATTTATTTTTTINSSATATATAIGHGRRGKRQKIEEGPSKSIEDHQTTSQSSNIDLPSAPDKDKEEELATPQIVSPPIDQKGTDTSLQENTNPNVVTQSSVTSTIIRPDGNNKNNNNSNSLLGHIAKNSIQQVLLQFPRVEQTLSGIQSLLRGIISGNVQRGLIEASKVNEFRSIDREIRQQKSIQTLESICTRQEQCIQNWESIQEKQQQQIQQQIQQQLEQERRRQEQEQQKQHKQQQEEKQRQLQMEIQRQQQQQEQLQQQQSAAAERERHLKEIENLRRQLEESQQKNVELNDTIKQTRQTLLEYEKNRGQRDQQDHHGLETISNVIAQKDRDIQERDQQIAELKGRQGAFSDSYQSRINEVIHMLQKRDKEIKDKSFKIRLLETENNKLRQLAVSARRKSSPSSLLSSSSSQNFNGTIAATTAAPSSTGTDTAGATEPSSSRYENSNKGNAEYKLVRPKNTKSVANSLSSTTAAATAIKTASSSTSQVENSTKSTMFQFASSRSSGSTSSNNAKRTSAAAAAADTDTSGTMIVNTTSKRWNGIGQKGKREKTHTSQLGVLDSPSSFSGSMGTAAGMSSSSSSSRGSSVSSPTRRSFRSKKVIPGASFLTEQQRMEQQRQQQYLQQQLQQRQRQYQQYQQEHEQQQQQQPPQQQTKPKVKKRGKSRNSIKYSISKPLKKPSLSLMGMASRKGSVGAGLGNTTTSSSTTTTPITSNIVVGSGGSSTPRLISGLVPNYDSLAGAGKHPKNPIVMFDSP